ncbi:MAG: DUF4034 domain-containing protein [Pseudomonas sp.]|uniref:hypothetical protein n=1 Tax=Pseudomonas sp. TaxID=306 RepID=UPI003BB66851
MRRERFSGYRILTQSLLFIFSIFISWTAQADDDADYRLKITTKFADAWQNENWPVLESMENQYLNPSERTPSGKRSLAVFEKNLSWFISIRPIATTLELIKSNSSFETEESVNGPPPSRYEIVNQEWDKVESKINNWNKAFPNSPNPKLAKAEYYIERGSYFRGSRWASDVHKEAWPIHQQNFDAAKKLLIDTQSVSRQNPIWFSLMLTIAGAQSSPQQEIYTLITDTLENGQGYPDAIQSAFHFMQPRWGGSYQQMDDFAQLANQKTEKQEHGGIYARLYWIMVSSSNDEMNQGFFKRSGVSWPMLSQSFEAIIQRFPAPRNISGYALFACMANDIPKAKHLLIDANSPKYIESWPRELQQLCSPF